MGSIKRLVIGPNSQLAQYITKENTTFVSAKNFIASRDSFDEVYFFFCEQRTFLDLSEKDFLDVNVNLTLKILEKIYNDKTKFYLYGTCELWNKSEGGVTIESPFNYTYSPYIKSKEVLVEQIHLFRNNKSDNIIIIHPFNFNTPYRAKGFLFSKIFDSIIKREKIQTGNLDFSRDLVHPSFILKRTSEILKDNLVGSGNLTHIKTFVNKLYKAFNMNIEDFLYEETTQKSRHQCSFYHKTDIKYNTLLEDTIDDIKQFKD